MKSTIATLGVAGLALVSTAIPAFAADNPSNGADKVDICHGGKLINIALQGVGGVNAHSGHMDDIVPPNELLPAGLNWTAEGIATFGNGCVPMTVPPIVVTPPPVVVTPPPVVVTPPPVVVTPPPVVTPPAVVEQPVVAVEVPAARTPAPAAAAPKGAAAAAPAAAAAVSRGTNQGYNAQTAVGGTDQDATWLAGLGVLLGAGAVVALRRKSRTESPTAG
jgi:LPXTG-motif cell wall-anchored protein